MRKILTNLATFKMYVDTISEHFMLFRVAIHGFVLVFTGYGLPGDLSHRSQRLSCSQFVGSVCPARKDIRLWASTTAAFVCLLCLQNQKRSAFAMVSFC